ncbi:hypothetical protein C4D60_Mb06t34080 [Musa balbisiana]|uniref:Uncharacterized protein n=1 Tax=Musa balbisiana TaxID=52838 RepID=A0A4V4H4D5_MUSBA|nr:hypothetical protein C4D60_Mb06t34080 [Musa balbisiana]
MFLPEGASVSSSCHPGTAQLHNCSLSNMHHCKLPRCLEVMVRREAETLPPGFKIGIIDDEVTGVEHGGSRCTYLKIGDEYVFFVVLRELKSLLG